MENQDKGQLFETIERLRRELDELSRFKATQEALSRTEHIRSELYRGLLDISPDAVFITDTDFRVVMCNKYAAQLCGYDDMQELIGKKAFDFTSPGHLKQAMETAQEIIRDKKIRRREFIIQRKDTSSFWGEVSASTLYSDDGTPQGFLGILRDITVQKQIEETLRESEQQYQNILNNLPCAVHVVDRDLRIVLFNNTFLQWNKELELDTDVIGKKISEVFPFLPVSIFEQYEHVFKTGEQLLTDETSLVGKNKIHTRTYKIPIFKNSIVTRVVTTIHNLNREDHDEESDGS
ncbi:MAG: PAS domain S-box protein [Candidatus Omnitrophica bacterium]|nr:PAS domain S-box protein [Candidatus Omnitrophota bacterium]